MGIALDTIRSLWQRRPVYSGNDRRPPAAERRTILWSMLLYVLVLVVRSWPNFSHPGLYAEDSIHYFNVYYGNLRPLTDIFQNPNGYYNIYNNLAAYLIARADILLQPFLYQTVCLLLAVITVWSFSRTGLVGNRLLLLVSPLFLGLVAMNHLYYYISLTFQMYVVILLLLAILLWRPPRTTIGWLATFLLCTLLIWSGPYSVLVVPFSLTFMVLFRGKDRLLIALLLVTAAYALSVTESTIMLENIADPNQLYLWIKTLIVDVALFGLGDSLNPEKILLVVSGLAALVFLLRRDSFFLRVGLLFLVVITASFAPLFLSNKYLMYQSIFPCHLLIGQFLWCVFLLFAADRLINRLPQHRTLLGSVFAGLIILLIVYDNASIAEKYRVPVLHKMPEFLRTVKLAEEMDLAKKGERVIVSTRGTGVFKVVAVVGDRSKNGRVVGMWFID